MKIPNPLARVMEPAWPKPQGYPDVLDAEGLTEVIVELCGQEADPEFVREAMEWRTGTLEWVPFEQLREGSTDINIRSANLEKKYSKLPIETTPSLIVEEDGEVVDGNHRYRIAKAKKAAGLWCYRLGWEPEENEIH